MKKKKKNNRNVSIALTYRNIGRYAVSNLLVVTFQFTAFLNVVTMQYTQLERGFSHARN